METISANVDRIRVLTLIERYHEAMSGLQVREIGEQQLQPHVALLKGLPADRICFQFIREIDYYLVSNELSVLISTSTCCALQLVTFTPNEQSGVDLQYHLLSTHEGKTTLIGLQPEELVKFAPVPNLRIPQIYNSGSDVDEKIEAWADRASLKRVRLPLVRCVLKLVL